MFTGSEIKGLITAMVALKGSITALHVMVMESGQSGWLMHRRIASSTRPKRL